MSAKRISSSNSVRPSIEDTSNWQKPSLIYSDNDTMSKDDLIEAITLRLTRLEELEQENIILKRKLNRYFLNYFPFVTALFRKPWMCHWVQLNYSAYDRSKLKLPVLSNLESSPHSFSIFFFLFSLFWLGKALYFNVATISFPPLAASLLNVNDTIQHLWPIKTNLAGQESNALGVNNYAADVTNCNFNPIQKKILKFTITWQHEDRWRIYLKSETTARRER